MRPTLRDKLELQTVFPLVHNGLLFQIAKLQWLNLHINICNLPVLFAQNKKGQNILVIHNDNNIDTIYQIHNLFYRQRTIHLACRNIEMLIHFSTFFYGYCTWSFLTCRWFPTCQSVFMFHASLNYKG